MDTTGALVGACLTPFPLKYMPLNVFIKIVYYSWLIKAAAILGLLRKNKVFKGKMATSGLYWVGLNELQYLLTPEEVTKAGY